MNALKGLALPQVWNAGDVNPTGRSRRSDSRTAAPVLCAHVFDVIVTSAWDLCVLFNFNQALCSSCVKFSARSHALCVSQLSRKGCAARID